jgi:hypothetical protein
MLRLCGAAGIGSRRVSHWGAGVRRFLFLVAALLLGLTPACAAERTVIYVLFDGFSPAELDAAHGGTPHFDQIKREGAWSRHLVPAFPTISLINHTTLYRLLAGASRHRI